MTPPPELTDDPLVGKQLGNFRIQELIAEGGMGLIYRAEHSVIGRQAAIKVLTKRYSSDRNMIKRLHREAQAVNRIGHPNIIDIFDFGQTPDNREYFVMEYLPGETLGQLLERDPRPHWSLSSQIMGQALDAVGAAHARGIIHRDIKPENILLVPRPDGSVLAKLLDFGIAKSIGLGPGGERLTSAGSVMGTPEYIAPEQIRGQPVDGRADIYALGVILFELVMGRRPFDAEKVISLLMAHLREPVPAMDDIPPEAGVPASVPDAVRVAMAKDPEQRFPDARAFAQAIGLETSTVAADDSTRALPEMFWEGDGHSESPAQAAQRSPVQVTAPGATMPPPAQVVRGRGKAWRWAVPLAVLLASGIGIGAKIWLRHDASTVAKAPKTPHKTPAAAATPAAFEPVEDLPALLTKLRRVLRRSMQSSEPRVRRIAIRASGDLRDSDAKALLVSMLKEDPEPSVRAAAAIALAELSDADLAATLRQVRGQNNPLTQVSIDEALMRLGQADGRSGLVAALASKEQAVGLSAALALAGAGDKKALPVLVSAVSKVQAIEQPAIIAAMGAAARLGHARALASLKQGLSSTGRTVVQLGCAEALAELGNEDALELLRALLKKGERTTQLVAARVLASVGDYAGLDPLREGVRAKNSATRALAASSLGAVADRAALPPLAAALDDSDPDVQVAAASSLARIMALMPNQLVRRSQNWVFAALERGDWSMRFAAIGVTSEMDPELAVELLGWALRDKDSRIRAAAVAKLGRLRGKSDRAVRILKVALADESPEVRANAASALGALAGSGAKKELASAVRDRDSRVGIAAAGALLAMGDDRYLRDLKAATKLRDPALRGAALGALGLWKSPRASRYLVAGLKDRSPQVRYMAALQLARRGDKRGLKELRRVATKEGADAQDAIRAIASLGGSPTKQLERLARSPNAAQRRGAISSAAELLEPAAALAILRDAARDPDVGVRRAAARGLARIAGREPATVGPLRRLTTDPDPAVRAAAAVGLAKLRPEHDIGGDAVEPVEPVKPAPLPEGRPQPIKPPSRDNGKPLFFDDSSRVGSYKLHIGRAETLRQRGKYSAALRHLKLAQRSMNQAPVLFDYGRVYLELAKRELQARHRPVAAKYLRRARDYFRQYLRRAPRGKLAKRARGGLNDVKRLGSLLK